MKSASKGKVALYWHAVVMISLCFPLIACQKINHRAPDLHQQMTGEMRGQREHSLSNSRLCLLTYILLLILLSFVLLLKT